MEAKPIVTSHGNQSLFSSLHKPLLEDLPKEPAEWRRSYGRPARNVQLEASFVPYDDDILPDDSVKTLVSRLYFHIFWTDCDLETYKQKIKEEINDWCAALKAKNIPDWLIVVFNSDENKGKTKLLPRSSVYDKIKSDFCSKTPDRIVVLEPLNGDSKSVSLWNQFLSRLRTLLLQAFTRHLQKYEDNMRALREERNKVGWNFQEYFIVQEELAFMFEMLGLFDDALIQYDELDALFTQFILNHASGQSVPWLRSLTEACKVWAGVSLHKPITWEKRDQIKDNKVTLLEFRNYLFSRQCAILLLLKRPGEIIQRAIDYLHETVQEMKTLDIEITEGGLDCWVYLSGLEVLLKCENMTDSVNPRAQALNTAYLWDYVCRKLEKLGELCGLMPGDSSSPSSDQLSLVIDLTSGMGLEIPNEHEEDTSKNSPRDKLREALSSRESFQRIYLEQSELAMGTFKYIGRFRSARMIGKNLADFYMKLGEPQKAENFLLDAMTSYHQEGWEKLRDEARLELAQCQYQVADHYKYVKTACQVASSCSLQVEDRTFHISEVLNIARTKAAAHILLKAPPLLKIEVTDMSTSKVTVDEQFYITMVIDNTGPCDIPCDSIWLTLTDCTPDLITGIDKRLHNLKTPVTRQTSNSSLDNRHVMNLKRMKKQVPSAIDLCLHFEGSPNEPVSTGIACINSHEVLKRNDSSGGMLKPVDDKVTKDTYNQSVCLKDVMLKPGKNTLEIICEGITSGNYRPGQAGVKIGHVELLKDMSSDLSILVTCDETFCEIFPESLIAGTVQEVTVCLHAGNIPIDPGSKVNIMPSDDISIETCYPDNTVILQKEVARGNTTEWKMKILQEPDIFGGKAIDNKIAFDCSWLPRPLLTTVTLRNPFCVTHRLHTAREMKYLQVLVHGQCETQFVLKNWSLVADTSKDVDLVGMNKPGTQQKVNIDQSCSFMWQLKSNIEQLPPLDLTFTSNYYCIMQEANEQRQLQYHFSLTEFQTLFTVKVEVTSNGENKVCRTGTLSTLKIHILQMPVSKPLSDQDLMYEVSGQSNWSMHGKSSSVFSIAGGSYSSSFQVMPLVAGFIPLPRVKLYKYDGAKTVDDMLVKEESERNVLDSTDEESSDSDQVSEHIEFNQGQVYYSSLGKQVHVYPEEVKGEVEVSIV
ncbi:trafficking protein particle complex subunit 10-like isoform X2 [Mercenaria mercenaria]|uniref:trafficking protein particle complex subunit 10-like isoform X2 n=1 Tax=Mercenaria mercenaria TaxID=6596 RepID=UPI00234EFC71|nr:trafficking protein particle complex subunit 10-like isoform X2 [Mercenaria mercenaria]